MTDDGGRCGAYSQNETEMVALIGLFFAAFAHPLRTRRLISSRRHSGEHVTAKNAEKSAEIAKKNYFCVAELATYPTPNVTAVPIITHHVHGTCVHCHRYNSTAKPNSMPTMAPR